MKPLVLACNLAPGRLTQVRVLCLRLGIRVRAVPPEDYGLPLAAVAEGRSRAGKAAPAPAFADEMLVLAGFGPGLLDAFLDGWRAARIPPVPLKAVLTETNARWSAAELHRSLAAEHAQLHP